MKSLERNKRANSVASLVMLAVLAGCQTLPVVKAPEDQTSLSTNKTGPGKAASFAASDAGTAALSGTDIVDQAPPLQVNAAKGGQYVFGNGELVANIPPGALSEDTVVRFIPLDTSKETNTAQRLAGMKFQMDIGKAFIKPGGKITVSSRADKRFVDELKSMYTDFTPERYSLSQDAQGNWNITMSIDGPRLEPMPRDFVPKLTDTRRGVMTEGIAPIKSTADKFRRESRIEAYCDYRSQALPAEPPKYPIEAECRWLSDHTSSADFYPELPLDGALAVGDLNDFDGSATPESAGSGFSISHPHVQFGRVMAAALNPGFHWITLKWPTDAVAQVRNDGTITSRSGSNISYKYTLTATATYSMYGYTCPTGYTYSSSTGKCTKTVTGTLSDGSFADWSLEKQGGNYTRVKLPGDGWTNITGTATSVQQNGAQDYTLYEFRLANGRKIGMAQSEVEFNTVINGNNVKVITTQGSAFSPGIFEEVADNLDFNGQGDANNYSVRKGYTPGGCYCNFVVKWDKIVEDTAPQPVRSRRDATPGRANNLVQAEYTIEMQAKYTYPNPRNEPTVGLGDIKQITSSTSNPLTVLRLRKMSPNLTFKLVSPNLPIPASSTIQLELQVEGESTARVYKFNGNDQTSITLSFPLHVKTDDPLKLEFKRAIVRDLDKDGKPTPKDLNLYSSQASAEAITSKYIGVQRNGLYEFDLNLEAQGGK